MSDSFFGFNTCLPDHELELPDHDDLDEDDRYNDETFGADAAVWEEDSHEKIAEYLELEKSALLSAGNGHHAVRPGRGGAGGAPVAQGSGVTADIERGLTQLVTDDVLDDPCIMSVRRSRPSAGVSIPTSSQIGRARSPPVSSLLESDMCGSPSTNSIWSTTPTRPSVRPPPPVSSSFEDPAIMSVVGGAAAPGRLPAPPSAKVRTVEELENDLLSRSPSRPPPGFLARPPPPDFSRPPPMRLPPPAAQPGTPGATAGERFQMPNTHVPPPSVTSILPPQLMNRDRGGSRPGAGRPYNQGRSGGSWHHGPGHHQHQHQHHHQQPGQYQAERRPQDPHAGLMTPKERQWLLNIQRVQIQGNTDYYFRHFMTRKLSQGRRDSRGGRGFDGGRQSEQREEKHWEHRNYKPPEIENSLGKLQVASVTAPRKIIDVLVINQDKGEPSRDHKQQKRDRQTLLLIERLYRHIMVLEELDRRAAGDVSPPPEGAPEGTGPEPNPEAARQQASEQLWSWLARETTLAHILTVRKGKCLILRCIPVLSSQQYVHIASTLLKHLGSVIHRDRSDNMLHKFYVLMQMVVSNSDLAQIIDLTRALTVGTEVPSTVPGKTAPFQAILATSFGTSAVMLLLLRGNQLARQDSAVPTLAAAWQHLSSDLVHTLTEIPTLAPPLEPLPPALLSRHVPSPALIARLSQTSP